MPYIAISCFVFCDYKCCYHSCKEKQLTNQTKSILSLLEISIFPASNGVTVSEPSYPTQRMETARIIDNINNHNLKQLVSSPTRQNHVLDLVFVLTPTLIKELHTAPGMSDHEIVTSSINCNCPLVNKKASRRVYLYHKGDITGIEK